MASREKIVKKGIFYITWIIEVKEGIILFLEKFLIPSEDMQTQLTRELTIEKFTPYLDHGDDTCIFPILSRFLQVVISNPCLAFLDPKTIETLIPI